MDQPRGNPEGVFGRRVAAVAAGLVVGVAALYGASAAGNWLGLPSWAQGLLQLVYVSSAVAMCFLPRARWFGCGLLAAIVVIAVVVFGALVVAVSTGQLSSSSAF